MTESRKTGLWGEIYASRYLRNKGYSIKDANYRLSGGEIDIIAEKDGTVCFVEVKTRSAGAYFSPSEAVDYQKENNIKNVAAAYISRYKIEKNARFDIIEIILEKETYKLIPILMAFIGGGLGILIYYTNPEIILNADNIWTALGIGIISGLSSTGTNQLIKQTFNKSEENKNE